MAVLCSIDYDQTFSIFPKGEREFTTTISNNTNCNLTVDSSTTDEKNLCIILDVNTTVNIDMCQFTMNSEELTVINNWSIDTNNPRNIKNIGVISRNTNSITIEFSSFTMENFQMYIKLFT